MLKYVLPWWGRWAAFIFAGVALVLFGMLLGERNAGEEHLRYVSEQASRSVQVARRQAEVVIQTEIKYRDRIQTVYVKGEEIEKQVPVLVSPIDDLQLGVSVGFVRSYNAAWSGEPAGLAASTDRDPAGIPLTEVAETDAHNAKACHAWRELALGLKEFHKLQQDAVK